MPSTEASTPPTPPEPTLPHASPGPQPPVRPPSPSVGVEVMGTQPSSDESQAPSSPAALPTSYRTAVTGGTDAPGLSPSASRARPRGLLPSPEALAAVRRLYAEQSPQDAGAILAAAKAAQPEAITDAPFSISARVSSSLFGVTRPAMVIGLPAVKDNDIVRTIIEAGEIVHVHKQPKNTLLMYLRSHSAKAKLVGQRCQFLGRTLTFDSLNPLSDAFYLDVPGIRSEDVASRLFRGFLANGCQPLYFNFTYRAPHGSITSGIVRLYFNSSDYPAALIVNGQVCDQVVLGGLLHSARARGASAVEYYLSPSKPSQHALRFDAAGAVVVDPPQQPSGPRIAGGKRTREALPPQRSTQKDNTSTPTA